MDETYTPISYRILRFSGNELVQGYAVQHPAVPDWLHLCVRRRDDFGGWTVDHFESGKQFMSHPSTSRAEAIERAVERVNNGAYGHSAADALRVTGYGWCVPEEVK